MSLPLLRNLLKDIYTGTVDGFQNITKYETQKRISMNWIRLIK